MSKRMQLNFFGAIDEKTGFGKHCISFCKALSRHTNLTAYPTNLVHEDTLRDAELSALISSNRDYDSQHTSLIMGYGPGISSYHGSRMIGYTLFEYTKFPEEWIQAYQAVDKVWTASKWGRDILKNNGIKAQNIQIVPAGIDPKIFYPRKTSPPVKPIRFVSIGKWERRKGFLELIQAFQRAFGTRDDVELHLLCNFGFVRPAQIERDLEQIHFKGQANIKFLPPLDSDRDVAQLLNQSHIFVLPTKCEGWGLPLLEAMACGLPVITTGHGGQSEFCNEDNALIIPTPHFEPIYDPFWYPKPTDWGKWATIDPDTLAEVLQQSADQYSVLREKALKLSSDIRSKWTWAKAAKKAAGYLEAL